ncbi:MAG: cellulose-binding protein [Epsilonproteobacteria bacterium]|nr:MAG: cellulose-binding protein [Campylobacterota bacterium]
MDTAQKRTKEKLNILPLGDSITGGTPYTYRYELYKKLNEAKLSFNFVGSLSNRNHYPGNWDAQNEGHAGWTTHDILENLDRWLNIYRPDIALIHLGTNDIAAISFSTFNPFIDDLTTEDSLEALKRIITRLREVNPDVAIYLAQILPMIEPNSQSKIPSILASWNNEMYTLSSLLSTETSPLYLVDMYSDFGDDDLYDGVHPNESGATKMAQRWADAILKNHS